MTTRGSTLLAIETSCDETGVAIVRKTGEKIEVLASAVASQVDVHTLTGGVVPMVAAREHEAIIQPLIESTLHTAGVSGEQVDGIAVTVGPGLQPALAVGVRTAKARSAQWNKPLIPVHHLEGHMYSALLIPRDGHYEVPPEADIFPALALIVSGGHTLLASIKKQLNYEVLGSTRDDAVGEAFDKVARLLGLPYPGGALLSKLAEQGDPHSFTFPRPMIHSGDLDFSFAGLKTAVLYAWRDVADKTEQQRANVAASFETAAVETLCRKVTQAIDQAGPRLLLLAGGVAANRLLRSQIEQVSALTGVPVRIAPLSLCGDNAVMIGQVGLLAYEAGRRGEATTLEPRARIPLSLAYTNAGIT